MNKKNYEMMEKYILAFPELVSSGYGLGSSMKLSKLPHIRNIVYAGMGGSAIAGDVVKDYLFDDLDRPFQVVRHYSLPSYADDRTLVIISSFSGNTEETISCYKDAKRRKALVLVITSGGQIGSIAAKNGDMLIELPISMPPRCALGMTLFALLGVLEGICSSKRVSADIKAVLGLMNDYQPDFDSAASIADELYGFMPILYTDERMGSVARRVANQFSENSKHFAHFNFIPEMNHNEIVGMHKPEFIKEKTKILFITFESDSERIRKRMLVTEKLLRDAEFKTFNVFFSSSNVLFNIIDAIMLFDLASLLLSAKNDEDPMLIKRIEKLKKELAG